MNISQIRRLLEQTNAGADYSHPGLQAQTRDIDLNLLQKYGDELVVRAAILDHAVEEMMLGAHPIQAFLHAVSCQTVAPGGVDDDEFRVLLTAWTKLTRAASKSAAAEVGGFGDIGSVGVQLGK